MSICCNGLEKTSWKTHLSCRSEKVLGSNIQWCNQIQHHKQQQQSICTSLNIISYTLLQTIVAQVFTLFQLFLHTKVPSKCVQYMLWGTLVQMKSFDQLLSPTGSLSYQAEESVFKSLPKANLLPSSQLCSYTGNHTSCWNDHPQLTTQSESSTRTVGSGSAEMGVFIRTAAMVCLTV